MTRTASCQCRGFRVIVEAEPEIVSICHCQICQRRTGVPLICNAYFPKSKVRLEGEQKIYSRDCSERRKLHNYFGPTNGSTFGWTLDLRSHHFGVAVGASTTAISRHPFSRSGRRRCTLGRCCRRTFSISRALGRFRAQAKALSH
jgi:hypothetical protein